MFSKQKCPKICWFKLTKFYFLPFSASYYSKCTFCWTGKTNNLKTSFWALEPAIGIYHKNVVLDLFSSFFFTLLYGFWQHISQVHTNYSLKCLDLCASPKENRHQRQNSVCALSLACFICALCWITLSAPFETPYSALSLHLAAVTHLCSGGTTSRWPRCSDEALGEVSGWHQPAGIGECGCILSMGVGGRGLGV